jgi:hypothetical protein
VYAARGAHCYTCTLTLCVYIYVYWRQNAYFGKARLLLQADARATQDELNCCGVIDLVLDLVAAPDDGTMLLVDHRRHALC